MTHFSILEPSDRIKKLESFDPNTDLWIVSDLRSKLDLQRLLLSGQDVLSSQAVLRVSEFWDQLMTANFPEFTVVTHEAMQFKISQILKKTNSDWALRPGGASEIYSYLDFFLPIVSHSSGPDAFGEWARENPEAVDRWGAQFLESMKVWRELLDDNCIARSWVSGLLYNEGALSVRRSVGKIVCDVGIDLKPYELEIFKNLSLEHPTEVLLPVFKEVGAYTKYLETFPELKKEEVGSFKPSEEIQFRRFPTMLAEVKDATSTIRNWLEQGVDVSSIAVVAPDIGLYWPVLQPYFEKDGIPLVSGKKVPIQNMISVSRWLSYVKTISGVYDKYDIELSCFSQRDRPVDYDKFRHLFSIVMNEKDLRRDGEIKRFFEFSDIHLKTSLTLKEFVSQIIGCWIKINADAGAEHLISIIKELLKSSKILNTSSFEDWVKFLESSISSIELKLLSGSDFGIECADVVSGDFVDRSHVYILGVTDEGLRQIVKVGALQSELRSLEAQTGFKLGELEPKKREFMLNWILHQKKLVAVVSFPETDFEGNYQAPSRLWLRGKQKSGEHTETLSSFEMGVWDTNQIRFEEDKLQPPLESLSFHTLKVEKGDVDYSNIPEVALPSLSASGIEDYLNCPFIFFAKKCLKLVDQPYADLDLDRMSRGKLIHAILAEVLKRRESDSNAIDDIENIIQLALKSENITLVDERQKKQIQNVYQKLVERFLKFEDSWMKQFEKPSRRYLEEPFDVFLDIKNWKLLEEETDDAIRIRGRLDRLDVYGEQAILIDYKSSTTSHYQYPKWIEKFEIQLLLYSMLVEAGAIQGKAFDILGAVYYDIKTFERDKGLLMEDGDGQYYQLNSRKKHKATLNQKNEMYVKLQEQIQHVVGEMKEGVLFPRPSEYKKCVDCRWVRVCRANHLN